VLSSAVPATGLAAANRPAHAPWDELKRAADDQQHDVGDLWRENRLSEKEFAVDPFAEDD